MIVGDDDSNELAHYGVKGMRWGVRKSRDTSSRKGRGSSEKQKRETSVDQWKKIANQAKKPSVKEALQNYEQNLDKSAAKFGAQASPQKKANVRKALREYKEEETGEKQRWKPTGKQVATVAAGAAFTAAVIYGAYKIKQGENPAASIIENLHSPNSPMSKYVPSRPGESISASKFNQAVSKSIGASWGGGKGYIQKSSFDQKEFELPVGHIFRRLSTSEEIGFWGPTYTTANVEDWKRYLTNFRHEKWTDDLKMVTFRAEKPIRVPDLVTRLNAMKTVLGPDADDTQALNMYKSLSGGSWKGGTATKFFSELGRLGYGAIVDDMDAGVVGETPLVLFATDAVGAKTNTPITSAMIKAAESTLTEISNRKT